MEHEPWAIVLLQFVLLIAVVVVAFLILLALTAVDPELLEQALRG